MYSQGSSWYVFSLYFILICISLYSVIASRLYAFVCNMFCHMHLVVYCVFFCVCHMYCVARRHTFAIVCCHIFAMWVRPFDFAQVQQGSAWVLDQTSYIVNLKLELYDNSWRPLGSSVRGLPLLWLPKPRPIWGGRWFILIICNCLPNVFQSFLPFT
jgi:hypothetical protein